MRLDAHQGPLHVSLPHPVQTKCDGLYGGLLAHKSFMHPLGWERKVGRDMPRCWRSFVRPG